MPSFKRGNIVRNIKDIYYYDAEDIRFTDGTVGTLKSVVGGEIKANSVFIVSDIVISKVGYLLRLSQLPLLVDVGWQEDLNFRLVSKDA